MRHAHRALEPETLESTVDATVPNTCKYMQLCSIPNSSDTNPTGPNQQLLESEAVRVEKLKCSLGEGLHA